MAVSRGGEVEGAVSRGGEVEGAVSKGRGWKYRGQQGVAIGVGYILE